MNSIGGSRPRPPPSPCAGRENTWKGPRTTIHKRRLILHDTFAMAPRPTGPFCRRTRREFLWEAGAGFTGLALTGLLSLDGFFNPAAAAEPSPRFANPL